MTTEDLPFFLEVRNASREFLHDNREFTLEQCQKWFAELPAERRYLIIVHEGERIGYFRLWEMPSFGLDLNVEIGADLAEVYRGKGLAREAYKTLLSQWPGLVFVRLEVLATNVRAYNLYRKLGFKNGLVTEVERDGRLIPSIHMFNFTKNMNLK